MTLNFENEQDFQLPFDAEKTAEQVVLHIIDREECPYEAEVNLTLVDDEEIHRINAEFRQMDKATDVLSFPVVPFASPADFSILEDDTQAFDFFHPESGELMLGDIVISIPHVMQQAEMYGHSLKREYSFLIAHSMLHLLGYDHMTPEDAALMEKRQALYLDELGITRDSVLPDGGVRSDRH